MYRAMRWVIGVALGFYFRRIERFHADRVPKDGPVLFASNHPNSLTDSFIIGASVSRKVNFVATVALFRFPPLGFLLRRCGVIPINRVKDDPKAMRTVADSFEACFRALGLGEAIGIFPEGITYDDSQLKEVKSGAARMALEFEYRQREASADNRAGTASSPPPSSDVGATSRPSPPEEEREDHASPSATGMVSKPSGLSIVPVGLTYSAKEMYRSSVLANFGERIVVAEFLKGYPERRKECIRSLTAEIERRIQALILHIPHLEHAHMVAGVRRLYFDRLVLGNRSVGEPISPQAQDLALSQRITDAVEYYYRVQPERAEAFAAGLAFYERWLDRLRLSDAHLGSYPRKRDFAAHSVLWGTLAVLGAPVAVYGWAHRLIPFALVKWAARRFAEPQKRKAQASTVAIAAGTIAFGLSYATYISIFHRLFGWPASLWYALSLPVSGLLAHYYLRETRRLCAGVRNTIIMMRVPSSAKRLLAMRQSLVAEIEAAHVEMGGVRQGPL